MAKGIRFKNGRIIDFQDTDWSIEVDPNSDFIEFIHSSTGKRFKFTSDGNIKADQGFKLASEILFEGTDFFIDASSGQLKISDGTNTFTFDDTGSATISNSLEADSVIIDGVSVSDKLIDTRNAINQLFIDNARQDFELGLNIIDMDDGQFEIYADDSKIADSSNVSLSLGSPLNGKGTVSLASSATNGFTEHIIEDFDFRPNSVVVTDNLETNPQNGTVTYEIEDENGNIVTIARSQLNQQVDVSNTIETYAVSTRAVLERNSTTDTSPVLDAFSVYISGQKPDDYLDATVKSVSGV